MPEARRGKLIEVAREVLLDAVRGARSEVFLVALAHHALASRARKLKLITALNTGSVAGGFLQPRGLRDLHAAGFELRSVRNLHAKVSIVDGKWGLVGSGNLTTSGLGGSRNGNVELGVILTRSQVDQAHRAATRWWRKAEVITAEDITRYEALAEQLEKSRRGRVQGHGRALPIEAGEELEKTRRRGGRTGLWLKMVYPGARSLRPEVRARARAIG